MEQKRLLSFKAQEIALTDIATRAAIDAQIASDAAAITALGRQSELADAFGKTKEGQIIAVEKQIEY